MDSLLNRFQIIHFFSVSLGVFDLTAGAGADVAADVDHVDRVRQVDLPLVHIVQHLLGPRRPDLIVPAVPEQPHADHDIPLERQSLLRLQELLLEPRTPAEGYDRVFVNHNLSIKVTESLSETQSPFPKQIRKKTPSKGLPAADLPRHLAQNRLSLGGDPHTERTRRRLCADLWNPISEPHGPAG